MADTSAFRQEKILLFKPVKVKSEYGSYLEDIEYITSARAGVLTKSMNREFSDDAIRYPESRTLIVRNHVPVDDNYVILWDHHWWRVTSYIRNKFFQNIEITISKVVDPVWDTCKDYEGS